MRRLAKVPWLDSKWILGRNTLDPNEASVSYRRDPRHGHPKISRSPMEISICTPHHLALHPFRLSLLIYQSVYQSPITLLQYVSSLLQIVPAMLHLAAIP